MPSGERRENMVKVEVFFFLHSPHSQTAVHQMSAWWCHHRLLAQLLSRSRRRGRSGCSACSLWFARLWEEHQSLARETLPGGIKYNDSYHMSGFIHIDTELKQFRWLVGWKKINWQQFYELNNHLNNSSSKISWFKLLKCKDFLVIFVSYDSQLAVIGSWTT